MRSLGRTPRWIGGLALCLLAATVFALLGRWQWDVAHASRGGLQNTAYAFNWWVFAVLAIGFWFKALHETARRDAGLAPTAPPAPKTRLRGPAPPTPRLAIPSPEQDPDVAAWNEWLTELNANPRR